MELSRSTLELLRDEAYLTLCRTACDKQLDVLAQEAAGLVQSRPPFGFFARKHSRAAFANSVRTVSETESALHARLTRITHLNAWLGRCIHDDLFTYLGTASPEFERMTRLQRLLTHWESGIQKLPDMLTGFARDLRALRQSASAAIEVTPATTPPCAHEFAVLRATAVRLEDEQKELDQIATAINGQIIQLAGNDVRLPTVPAFRRTVWVDWLSLIPLEQAVGEITRVEFEVRSFLQSGLQPVAAKLQATRAWCTLTQENLVQQYWTQLRAHALAHYVEERDVDEVLESLAQHYEPEIARGEREPAEDIWHAER